MADLKLVLTLNKNGSITASWAKIADAVRYEAFMYPIGETYAIYNEKNITATSYTSKAELPAKKQYKVTVTAYSSSKLLGSAAAQVLIPSDFYNNTPLEVPKNVRASADTTSVTVNFDQVNRATSYDVLFDGSVTNVTGTTRRFTGLIPKTRHTYAVRAKNANVTGAYSATGSIMTLPAAPAVPGNIKKSVTETTATISWNAVSGASSYDIQFNGTIHRVATTSKTFTGLTSGKGYPFQVRANNADASGSYSASMTVTPAPKVPSAVNAVSTENTVTVSWSAVAGAIDYVVRFNGNEVHAATRTTCSFNRLEPKTSYTYQVCAKGVDGDSAYSPLRTIKTLAKAPEVPTAISAATTEDSVTLNWEAVPGATSYDILFDDSVYNVTGISRTFKGLTPDSVHTWQIRSKNADAISGYSPARTVRTTSKPPANSSVTTSENSLSISWDAVSGATGYDILLNGTVYPVSGTAKTFSGLNPNTAYTYQIRVKNANGVSSYSTARSVKTAPVPPVSPSVTVTNNSATIKWNSVPGATSYDILINGSTYHVTGTSKTITGLAPGTRYTYQVRSNNADGSSSYGAAQTVTTKPNPPAVPANVSATATADSVTVRWSAVSGATSYDVSFNGSVYRAAGTSKTFTGLTSGTSYRYAVRANNEGGSSAYSAVQSIQTLLVAPAVPENVNAAASSNIVTVTWNAVAGAAGYDVLFDGTVYSTGDTSKVFTGLAYDTNYSYRVRATNAAGVSAYSAEKVVRTQVKPPAVPDNIRASATTDSVTVSWDASVGATSYDLSFGGADYHITGTSKTIDGLTPDTGYTYALRANNEGGSSAYSTIRMVRTTPTIPDVPENVLAHAAAHSVLLSWNEAPRATNYDILFGDMFRHVAGNALQFLELDSNTEYTYKVRANNSYGNSDYSPEKTVRTLLDTPTGIQAQSQIYSMKISWNPVPGATGYDISFAGKVYHVTDTFIEFDELRPETGYEYAVCAKNEYVYSEYSPVFCTYTKREIPDVPSIVYATSTTSTVRVMWNPVHGANDYFVMFDGEEYQVSAGSRMTVFRVNRSAPHKTFFDLEPDTQYSFCVRASNESGSSDYSPLQFTQTQISGDNGLWDSGYNRIYPDGRIPYMGLDPVNAVNGAFLWSYTLLKDFGKDALHFTIMYDSRRDKDTKILGKKWTWSLNYLLTMTDQYAYFSTPYDEIIPFHVDRENNCFSYAQGSRPYYTMEGKADGTYSVRHIDGTEYRFNSNLSLNRIIENGLVICRFESDGDGRIIRIEGRYGAAYTIEYANGRISGVTDAAGNQIVLSYQNQNLDSIRNAGGNSLSFTYDASGNLTEVTDYTGKCCLSNEYDDFDRVVAQRLSGRGSSYAAYDDEGRVTVFTDELGNDTKYYYDEKKRITCVEMSDCNLQNRYDSDGRLTEQTDALGNKTQMFYDDCGRMNRVVHPDGTQEQISYNDRNYPVHVVNRDKTESFFEYDGENNLILARDERGNESLYSYDTNHNLVTYTDKNGKVWTYEYDESNHLKRAQDPEGNIYQYLHDAAGRLVSHTSPMGRNMTYQYSETGELLRMTDADGTVAFEYNQNGNRIGVTDRMGNKQRLEYNEAGQVSLVTDFSGNIHTFAYDEKGSLIRETDPLGYSTTCTYDAFGNCTSWTDKRGNQTVCSFNAANQLTQVRDAAGGLLQYTYDTMGQIRTVVDALNYSTNYEYDAEGRLIRVTNALGDSTEYTYDQTGNLLTKTAENGSVLSYAYDKENRLISMTSEAGTVRFTYDTLGRVIGIQDMDGYTETSKYDGDGNLTEYSDKEGITVSYRYDMAGRLIEETDPNGGKTLYRYDKNGRCIKHTDASGNEYRYEYDGDGRMTRMTDPIGNETVFEYDARGDLAAVTDAMGRKTAFEYDGNGNLIREINPAGGEISYTYDSLDRLVSVRDEEGYHRSYEYDANSNRTAYTDAEKNKWSYEYDALNRLKVVNSQNGGRLVYGYTKTGQIAEVTDQEGAKTQYRYDTLGRLLEMSDALGHSLRYTYDSLGRVLSQTDANGNTTKYTYSPVGNLLSVTSPEGGTVTYTYNALGQVVTETDAMGNTITYEYDALGQMTSVTDAGGGKTAFTYTPNGKIATVTDADGNKTEYKYDACGNLTQAIAPDGTITAYEYDVMNNQIKECLATSGKPVCATLWQYDKKGRVVREINAVSGEKVYTYDGEDNIITIADEEQQTTEVRYDLNSRPVSMRYSDGKEAHFRYNKRGELIELTDWNGTAVMEYGLTGRLGAVTDHNGRKTGYAYDAAGNITGITYPDASEVRYFFDKNNRMTKVMDAEGGSTQYNYDAAGNILSILQPGNSTAFTYNAKGLPVKIQRRFDDGTSMEENLAYDAMGRILQSDRKGSSPEFVKNIAYSYTPLGQLSSCRDGQNVETYGYDMLGNRSYKEVNGVRKAAYQYNELSQLVAKTENGRQYSYGYDRRGNLTEEKCGDRLIRQYLYDATGHMCLGKNLESREETEYGYNALYMRVKSVQKLKDRIGSYRSHAANTGAGFQPYTIRETSYVTDFLSGTNNELMAYEKGFGAVKTVFGQGYERLNQKVLPDQDGPQTLRKAIAASGGGKVWFQSDLYGSPLFAANEQGDVQRFAQRSVWGELRLPQQEDINAAGMENNLRFTSFCFDPAVGVYFAHARFYDAGQGRMFGRDPIKRGVNAYPYCDNDPVNHVDPTGEIPTILAGGLIGGAVGAFGGFVGSAVSQYTSGEKFSVKKAIGSAANGAIVGAARGAMVGSGIGAVGAFAVNFGAGALGSAAEQKISTGKVSFGDSMVGGLINGVSGAIYGNSPLGSVKSAFGRGALAGGATAGINNLYNVYKNWKTAENGNRGDNLQSGYGWLDRYSYGLEDPRGACGTINPLMGLVSASLRKAVGYAYKGMNQERQVKKKSGFDVKSFVTDVAIGSFTGGAGSVMFYGADKMASALRGNIRGNKGGSNAIKGSRTPEEAGINVADSRRIQNAATRTDQDIVVVGSRANGTATTTSDWDYYMTGKSSQRHSAASSLPRGTSGGETNYLGGDSGIDIFVGYPNSPNYEPLITDKPHVIFKP